MHQLSNSNTSEINEFLSISVIAMPVCHSHCCNLYPMEIINTFTRRAESVVKGVKLLPISYSGNLVNRLLHQCYELCIAVTASTYSRFFVTKRLDEMASFWFYLLNVTSSASWCRTNSISDTNSSFFRTFDNKIIKDCLSLCLHSSQKLKSGNKI